DRVGGGLQNPARGVVIDIRGEQVTALERGAIAIEAPEACARHGEGARGHGRDPAQCGGQVLFTGAAFAGEADERTALAREALVCLSSLLLPPADVEPERNVMRQLFEQAQLVGI